LRHPCVCEGLRVGHVHCWVHSEFKKTTYVDCCCCLALRHNPDGVHGTNRGRRHYDFPAVWLVAIRNTILSNRRQTPQTQTGSRSRPS